MFNKKYPGDSTTPLRHSLIHAGGIEPDNKRPEEETGYISASEGDSGSPYWISSTDTNGRERMTMVAMAAGPPPDPNYPLPSLTPWGRSCKIH